MKVVIWDKEYDFEWDEGDVVDIDALNAITLEAKQAYLRGLRDGTIGNPPGLWDNSPSLQSIDEIIACLPCFEKSGSFTVEWPPAEKFFKNMTNFPYPSFSHEFYLFLKLLHDSGFIFVFNWIKWEAGRNVFQKMPELIDVAGYETIRRMFTAHVRQDRFCEGHLARMLTEGVLARLVQRLAKLRQDNLLPLALVNSTGGAS
ncbi:MAG TPA: DUF6508 domain-containing protein [Candidatus Ozemobacteraceae bacterium]|nr:DUF6508 domain-containing protein [Candidatus Ozemobacteraceae bacterium]